MPAHRVPHRIGGTPLGASPSPRFQMLIIKRRSAAPAELGIAVGELRGAAAALFSQHLAELSQGINLPVGPPRLLLIPSQHCT